MRKIAYLFCGGILGFCIAPVQAQQVSAQSTGERPVTTVSVDEASPFDTAAIGEDALHKIAGREDVYQYAGSDHDASVSGNAIGDNSTTGTVQVADNAFQNLSGLSIVNINTGNNVALNAALNVNISTPQQ